MNQLNKKTIAVGMSGGLDSTIAAYLLKKQGYNIIGLTMKTWGGSLDFKSTNSGCYGPNEEKNIAWAKEAAKALNIPHFVIDVSKEFREEILSYFKKEYSVGRTPNPCVFCNACIKFGYLIEKAHSSGVDFDLFATGHYAQIEYSRKYKQYVLKRGTDRVKDQSYFLYRLNQDQLKKTLFPLGKYHKRKVRKMAEKLGFAKFAQKEESQDFMEHNNYSILLGQDKPGDIIDYQGKKIGEHRGIWHFTIGQRKGLLISSLKEPYYVLKIDAINNSVIVGPKKLLLSSKTVISNINWIIPSQTEVLKNVKVKCRYGSSLSSGRVVLGDGGQAEITFAKPQLAITPGQSAVIYKSDLVLGGGIVA